MTFSSAQWLKNPGYATGSIYRRLSEALQKQAQSRPPPSFSEHEEKLKHLKKYGADFVKFIADKNGRLKEKFDKVLITSIHSRGNARLMVKVISRIGSRFFKLPVYNRLLGRANLDV